MTTFTQNATILHVWISALKNLEREFPPAPRVCLTENYPQDEPNRKGKKLHHAPLLSTYHKNAAQAQTAHNNTTPARMAGMGKPPFFADGTGV